MEWFQRKGRREFLQGIVLAMGAGALSGCACSVAKQGGQGSGKAAGTPTVLPVASKIKLVYGRPAGNEFDLLGKATKAFAETSEGARFEVEDRQISGDPVAGLMAMEAGGGAPDVHIQLDEMIPEWARAGLLLSLDPFLAAEPKFDLGDFYERSLANARYKGQLWALPWGCAGAYLFINKDLFQADGVALPKPDWSWDEYRMAALKLTHAGENQWGAAPVTDWWQMAERVWQNGAEVFNGERTRCLLDQPGAMEAIEFWANLAVGDKAVPDASAMGAGGAMRLFATGRLAMYEDGLWLMQGWRQVRFKWDLAYLPYRRRRANMLWSGSQAISGHSKQREGAWLLLKYLTGPEALLTFSAALRVPCARKSVDAKRPYIDPSLDVDWNLVQQGVEAGRLLEVTAQNAQVTRLLDGLLRAIMVDGLPVKRTVDQYLPQINQLIGGQ